MQSNYINKQDRCLNEATTNRDLNFLYYETLHSCLVKMIRRAFLLLYGASSNLSRKSTAHIQYAVAFALPAFSWRMSNCDWDNL